MGLPVASHVSHVSPGTRLLQLQRSVTLDSDIPDELLYGRTGYLYALLYVNKEIGPNTVEEAVISKVSTPSCLQGGVGQGQA